MQAVTISQISPPELESLIETVLNRVLNRTTTLKSTQQSNKTYVYGIKGLARLLDCSHPTAQRVKNSLPASTYSQTGRKIIFDEAAVLAAINKKGGSMSTTSQNNNFQQHKVTEFIQSAASVIDLIIVDFSVLILASLPFLEKGGGNE